MTDQGAVVEDVTGDVLNPVEMWSLIGLGVLSLIVTGVLSALLGALVDEHRLSASGLGFAATLEALTMAAAMFTAGLALRPHRIRLIAALATALLLAANLATLGAHDAGIYWVRAVAGIGEGIMLWLASSMIVRTGTPERWAALLFFVLSIVQLGVAAALTAIVLPRWGADGGYLLIAAFTLPGFGFALLAPRQLGALPGRHDAPNIPTARGWIGLFAAVLYTGATGAVSVYLVPLGQAAGLSVTAARVALSAALGAQIFGSLLAAVVAGRVRYIQVFAVTTIGYLAVWGYYTMPATATPFITVTALSGLVAMFVPPFLVPMLIDADKTRRAALLAPSAQLLSGGLGPFAAAWAVAQGGMSAMLAMSAGLLVAGLLIIIALRITASRAIDREPNGLNA